jgi:hypothetical protein
MYIFIDSPARVLQFGMTVSLWQYCARTIKSAVQAEWPWPQIPQRRCIWRWDGWDARQIEPSRTLDYPGRSHLAVLPKRSINVDANSSVGTTTPAWWREVIRKRGKSGRQWPHLRCLFLGRFERKETHRVFRKQFLPAKMLLIKIKEKINLWSLAPVPKPFVILCHGSELEILDLSFLTKALACKTSKNFSPQSMKMTNLLLLPCFF